MVAVNEVKLPQTITIEEAANLLNLSKSKVTRLIEEQALIAVEVAGKKQIPAALISNGQVIPALRGTLILLSDLGLSNDEILEWILSENEDLGETPLAALTKGHKAPVRRAAQLLAELY